MARRGTYAKGQQRHDEILDAALLVVAREGYRQTTARDIAAAAGLSQAGLTHYFDSKDHLLTEILVRRHRRDLEVWAESMSGAPDLEEFVGSYLAVLRRNATQPGLVELTMHMAIEAGDPGHPAHAFFRERSTLFRAMCAQAVTRAQRAGIVTDVVGAETLARTIEAVGDGACLHWCTTPSVVDVEEITRALFALLSPRTLSPGRTAALTDAALGRFRRRRTTAPAAP